MQVQGDATWLVYPFIFSPGECVRETSKDLEVTLVELPKPDIHHESNLKLIAEAQARILIYSGFGGVILRDPVLNLGKRILHVHGGLLPFYRGSTTFYYSFLVDGKMGVSALWFGRKIDAGPILATRTFIPPKYLDIDRVVDPMARADLLSNVLLDYAKSGYFPQGVPQNDHNARLYYVIHPVLKHIALCRLGVTT